METIKVSETKVYQISCVSDDVAIYANVNIVEVQDNFQVCNSKV